MSETSVRGTDQAIYEHAKSIGKTDIFLKSIGKTDIKK